MSSADQATVERAIKMQREQATVTGIPATGVAKQPAEPEERVLCVPDAAWDHLNDLQTKLLQLASLAELLRFTAIGDAFTALPADAQRAKDKLMIADTLSEVVIDWIERATKDIDAVFNERSEDA